jgi:hypothetical protein
MSSILPKGIVVNTAEISGDIERIDREPLDLEEIAKLWKGEKAIPEVGMSAWLILKYSVYHNQPQAA